MDSRLLYYYERELKHLREMGSEFAREFPKIAGRLSLEEFTCADPYVERLLEGFAFLSGRVHLKLDSEFPRITQSLLQTVCPHYLCPTPSMTVVQIQPDMTDSSLADGIQVPRGTSIRGLLGRGDRTACEYRTAHPVTLYPITIQEAHYITRDLQVLDLPRGSSESYRGTKAAIQLRMNCASEKKFAGLKLDEFTMFLRGTSDTQAKLYEQIFGHARAIVIQPTTRPAHWREIIPINSDSGLKRVGFDDSHALLPYGPRSFQGYRLLHEYFAFPQRFLFFTLCGLSPVLRRAGDSVIDVILLLDQAVPDLEGAVDASNFVPYCTPAINLFPKRCDRIHLNERFAEHHVVPDRTRPRDFEVYDVTSVTGYGDSTSQTRSFMPFYSARDDDREEPNAYFTINRVPRAESQKEQREGRRSKYGGSEVFISLVDAKSAPFEQSIRQLGIEALCTNRDLPMFLPIGRGNTDFTLVDFGGPILGIHCVSPPTAPKPSWAEGQTAWRLISHLSLNYLSLIDVDGANDAAGLRDLLALYGELADPHIRKQINGVVSAKSKAIVRHVSAPGPITFARGLEATITLDEAAFEGTGSFLLGAVLEVFFAKYISINSFVETVIKTMERGEIMRWPARIGRRHIL